MSYYMLFIGVDQDMVTIGITPQILFHQYQMSNKIEKTINEQSLELSAVGHLITQLTSLNNKKQEIKVIVFSSDNPDTSIKIFDFIEQQGGGLKEGIFTNGSPMVPYIQAMEVDLFISNEPEIYEDLLKLGMLAVLVLDFKDKNEMYKVAFHHHLFKKDSLVKSAVKVLKLLGYLQKKMPQHLEVALITTKDRSVDQNTKELFWFCECRINSVIFIGDCNRNDFLTLYKPHLYFDGNFEHDPTAIQSIGDGLMYL